MKRHPSRALYSILSLTVALGLVMSVAADAAKAKKKKRSGATAAYSQSVPRESNEVYVGNMYMGTAPDPFLRLMFQREMSLRWGGSY